MTQCLLPNFLQDPKEYQSAETLWRSRFNQLVSDAGESHLWHSPWIDTSSGDATPFRDANPIFSAVCPSRRLGIRIIQLPPTPGAKPLTFWTDKFAQGDPEEIDELVISCILTDDTLATASDLIGSWINDGQIQARRETIPIDGPRDPER